tara:strand:- start:779 stop:952 length:174 start_codon:yes stop_codon:yes gene_type:complete
MHAEDRGVDMAHTCEIKDRRNIIDLDRGKHHTRTPHVPRALRAQRAKDAAVHGLHYA